MKTSEMIAKLQTIQAEHGDIEVMFQDVESCAGPWSATSACVEVAGEDQYPEDWNMPEGFKFVEISG